MLVLFLNATIDGTHIESIRQVCPQGMHIVVYVKDKTGAVGHGAVHQHACAAYMFKQIVRGLASHSEFLCNLNTVKSIATFTSCSTKEWLEKYEFGICGQVWPALFIL